MFFIPDDRTNLTAYIGVEEPMSVFCNFALPITSTPMELQELLKPSGAHGWHTKGDEMPIYIYDFSTVDFCGGAMTDDHRRDGHDPAQIRRPELRAARPQRRAELRV